MKKILWGIVVVVVLILATKQLTASGKSEAPVPEGVYRFYYYPTSNFYYDVAQGNFVYTLDGGRTWEVQKAAAPQTAKAFNDRKVIDSPEPRVWKYNNEHRAKYGGLVTDYRERAVTAGPPPVVAKKEKIVKQWKKQKKTEARKSQDKQDKEESGWKHFPGKLKVQFKKLGKED